MSCEDRENARFQLRIKIGNSLKAEFSAELWRFYGFHSRNILLRMKTERVIRFFTFFSKMFVIEWAVENYPVNFQRNPQFLSRKLERRCFCRFFQPSWGNGCLIRSQRPRLTPKWFSTCFLHDFGFLSRAVLRLNLSASAGVR